MTVSVFTVFNLSPRATLLRLFAVTGCLFIIHALTLPAALQWGWNSQFVVLFSLAAEQNVPTLFATALFFAHAALAFVLHRNRRGQSRWSWVWLVMSGIFIFLAIDEYAMLHERLGPLLRDSLGTSGWLYRAWVIPYIAALLILAGPLVLALRQLDGEAQTWLVAGGILFLLGAVGMEMFGGREFEARGGKHLLYWLLMTIEETLELTGQVFAIYGWLLAIERNGGATILLGDATNVVR